MITVQNNLVNQVHHHVGRLEVKLINTNKQGYWQQVPAECVDHMSQFSTWTIFCPLLSLPVLSL